MAGGVGLGVVALLWFGGLDAIRHYTLRHLLSRNGHMPRRYVRFLNYGVRLIFLKRVGSGYIFIHRLFLEHFAARREADGDAGSALCPGVAGHRVERRITPLKREDGA